MTEPSPGDVAMVPAVVEEVTPDFVYMHRPVRYQYHPFEVIPSLSVGELEAIGRLVKDVEAGHGRLRELASLIARMGW
jgi:hypothetical protein